MTSLLNGTLSYLPRSGDRETTASVMGLSPVTFSAQDGIDQ